MSAQAIARFHFPRYFVVFHYSTPNCCTDYVYAVTAIYNSNMLEITKCCITQLHAVVITSPYNLLVCNSVFEMALLKCTMSINLC